MSATRVDLWLLPLEPLAIRAESKLAQCLTCEEQQQAERYLRPATGVQFRVTRGMLRHILSEYLGLPPAAIPLVRLPMGKPALDPERCLPAVCFNVSHSQKSALVAIAREREVGIDLESRNRQLDVMGMAERFFAPEETAELRNLSVHQRHDAFLRFWTRKEALLKGQGRGLSQDWTDVRVGSLRESPVTLTGWDQRTKWQVHDLQLNSQHVAALAAQGTQAIELCWHEADQLL